jgi:hypothetical protein
MQKNIVIQQQQHHQQQQQLILINKIMKGNINHQVQHVEYQFHNCISLFD